MRNCEGCGAETARTRTRFDEKMRPLRHECDKCAPGSFDPDWLRARPAAVWEAWPEKYDKVHLEDGRTGYRSKEEWRADQEAKMAQRPADEVAAERKAHEEKRRTRRTKPLTKTEQRRLIERLRPRYAARAQAQHEERERARYAWLTP